MLESYTLYPNKKTEMLLVDELPEHEVKSEFFTEKRKNDTWSLNHRSESTKMRPN